MEAVEDEMIELETAIRRLVYLNVYRLITRRWARLLKAPPKSTGDKEKDVVANVVRRSVAVELNAKIPEQDLRNHYLEIQFRTCASAATIMRYLIDIWTNCH